MKKFFVLFAVLSLVFAGTAIAGGGSFADSGTNYNVGSNHDANGYFLSMGDDDAKVRRPMTGSFSTNNVAGSFSAQKVDSDAWAIAPIPKRPYQSAKAYGDVRQWSEAGVNPAPGTWAVGGQNSGAGYYAFDRDTFAADAEGNACTVGGTLVGATRFDTRRSSTAMAGAVTGSMGSAYAGCHDYDTYTFGGGEVEHATYANKRAGSAWTGGSASYSYETNGGHNAMGAGLAATGGVSNVTYGCRGITATATSVSFSTSGPTNANGGVHISNFPR
jgi:hypothetical protein